MCFVSYIRSRRVWFALLAKINSKINNFLHFRKLRSKARIELVRELQFYFP